MQCFFFLWNLLYQAHMVTIEFYLDYGGGRPWTSNGVCEVPRSQNQYVHQDQQSHQAHQLDVSDDLKHRGTGVMQSLQS